MTGTDADRQVRRQRWDGLIVVASGTSWDDTWLSEKHLALRLADRAPVLFVDPRFPY
jgi:teichuronic acid biosynthesis glycosyltransferase TuaH